MSSEKSANDHYRQNLKRKFCAKPRGGSKQCSLKTTSAESQEQRKQRRNKAPHAANAFWSLWIRRSRRLRGETQPGSFLQGRKQSWQLPKPKSGQGQTTSNGSAKSDISSWFAKRAFRNQSGQGGPAETSHHRKAGQASCPREQAIDCQTQGHVGAATQNAHYTDQFFFFRKSQRACGSKSRKLKNTCSSLRFTRGNGCIRSGISFTLRSRAQERNCKTDLHPDDNW